jgi:hypothetical protein
MSKENLAVCLVKRGLVYLVEISFPKVPITLPLILAALKDFGKCIRITTERCRLFYSIAMRIPTEGDEYVWLTASTDRQVTIS